MEEIADALYTKLSTDFALAATGITGIYPGIAPQGVQAPFVTYMKSDGFDRRVFGARATIWTEWMIRGWDEGDSHVRCQRIAAAIDDVLDENEAGLTVAGRTVLCLRRIGQLPDLPEEAAGLIIRSAGARYEIEVSA